jgi:SOS regulatory protein LexA
VVPEGQAHESFDWGTSLQNARAAFGRKDPRAAPLLYKAFDDAARMARQCYDEFLRLSPNPVPADISKDWNMFLTRITDSMWDVFLEDTDLVKDDSGDDLQSTFETIRDAALTALLALKYATREGAAWQDQQIAAENLRKLITHLRQARSSLERQSGVREVAEAPQVIDLPEVVQVPRLGRIAAGVPIIAVESYEDFFPLPRQLVGEGTLFILEVKGESMIDAGILDRDWVVIRQQPTAENGEIVVARIEEEVTVKTFKRSGGRVWLAPRNKAFEEIPGDNATILGKVVAVLRRV